MKFISLIASILLIVLITQDLTQGLPVNDTTVQNSCPEGFELIEGNCISVNSTSNVSEIESSTAPAEEPSAHQEKSVTQSVSSETVAPCPAGMGRGKSGLCLKMKFIQTMEVTPQSPVDLTTERIRELTTELNTDRDNESTTEYDVKSTTEATGVNGASSTGRSVQNCPQSMKRNKQGVCKPFRSSKVTKDITQSSDELTTELPTDLTTELVSELTTEFATDLTTELVSDLTTESETELTTERIGDVKTASSREKSLKNCPQGMKRNKQGVCKPFRSSKMAKGITQPLDEFTTELPTDLTTEFATDLTTEFATDLTTELNTQSEIKSTTEIDVEASTEFTAKTTDINPTSSRGKSIKNCPEGMKRNKQGVCKSTRSSKMIEVTTESTNDLTTESNTESEIELTTEVNGELTTELIEQVTDDNQATSGKKGLKVCPKGTQRNRQGICRKITSSKTVETTTQSVDDLTTELNTDLNNELTTEFATEEVSDVDTTTSRGKGLKNCPEGMKRNKQGVCKQFRSSKPVQEKTQLADDTTTESAQESIAEVEETSSQKENLKDCPEGTEVDEQGACQKIKSANRSKTVTDLKALLKINGTCPDNYKMIEGRCLYIKNKVHSTLSPMDSQFNDTAPVVIRPKSGDVENYKTESVPVLSDNSCPEGTEYSEYGLCQKRVGLPKSNRLATVDGRCQNNYELINGKCVPRNTKAQIKPKSTTPATVSLESTTITTENIDYDEVPKSTSTVKSTTQGSDME